MTDYSYINQFLEQAPERVDVIDAYRMLIVHAASYNDGIAYYKLSELAGYAYVDESIVLRQAIRLMIDSDDVSVGAESVGVAVDKKLYLKPSYIAQYRELTQAGSQEWYLAERLSALRQAYMSLMLKAFQVSSEPILPTVLGILVGVNLNNLSRVNIADEALTNLINVGATTYSKGGYSLTEFGKSLAQNGLKSVRSVSIEQVLSERA